ncbi:MAG: EI24 domain-containing protein [Mariprofundaceae bacterium]|nr:EI24 domain-containing protein [Mariprofundaceae bacterium]
MLKGGFVLLKGMKELLSKIVLRRLLFKMFFGLLLLSTCIFMFVLLITNWIAVMWLPETEAWWAVIVSLFVWVISFAVSASLGAVLYLLFSGTVVAPYLDMLAAQVDHSSVSEQPWWQQVKQSAQNTTKPMVKLLSLGAICLALLLIPIVGAPLAGVLWFYACMRFMLFELIDVPCSRRSMLFEDRELLVQQHVFFYYSFALSAMFLMMIPILNILIHPSAVVGLILNTKAAGLDS